MSDKINNPRYIEYARAHQKTPEDMLAFDRERYPSGVMCGFILWNTDRIREYNTIRPGGICCMGCHPKPYDAWLHARVNKMLAEEFRQTVEVEVARLKTAGLEQKDFAAALKGLLEDA